MFESAAAGLAHKCEGFDEKAIERFAAAGTVAEREASLFEVEIGLRLQRFFEGRDFEAPARDHCCMRENRLTPLTSPESRFEKNRLTTRVLLQ